MGEEARQESDALAADLMLYEIMQEKIKHLKSQRDILEKMVKKLRLKESTVGKEKKRYYNETIRLQKKITELRAELDYLADMIEAIYVQ